MNNVVKITYQVNISYKVNRMLYYIKRIKLFDKLIPDSVYKNINIKRSIGLLIILLKGITKFILEALYIFVFVWFPVSHFNICTVNQKFDFYINILFFLSCILGSFQDSKIFKLSNNKYICLKILNVNAKEYITLNLMWNIFTEIVLFSVLSLFLFLPININFFEYSALLINFIGFRFTAEAFQLWIYNKNELILSKHWCYFIPLFILSVSAAYLPLFVGIPYTVANIFFKAPTIILISILLVFSVFYIFNGFKGYNTKSFLKAFNKKELLSEIVSEEMQDSSDSDEDIFNKEKINFNFNKTQCKNNKKTGIEYINSIFFNRVKGYLTKSLLRRITLIVLISLTAFVYNIFNPIMLNHNIFEYLPVIVISISMLNMSDKICRTLYFSCDRNLLSFSFYRNPKLLKNSYLYRLKKICSFNLIIGSIAFIIVLMFSSLINEFSIFNIVMLFLEILFISIFFSIYYISVYYLFQPYQKDYKFSLQELFISFLTTPLYLTCFILKNQVVLCTTIIFALTVCYFIITLYLIPHLAPINMKKK